jgi:hypothetical protein
MLISKTVMVRWNGFTRKHYEEKGYQWTRQNDLFECKIEDLMIGSTVRVEVKCDYCTDGMAYKEYRSYLEERKIIAKDCCKNRKCMVVKSEEVSMIKYGVSIYSKTEESRKHNREFFQTPKEEVVRTANQKGLQILNIQDYENDRTRLFVVCNNHSDKGIQETNFANIKKNKYCCIYIRPEITSEAKKLDGQIVYDDFLKYNLIPMFDPCEYEGNSQPLPYKCPLHLDKDIQYRSYANLKYSVGCEYCSRERTGDALRNNESDVFIYFESRGLTVLDNQKYIGKDQQISFKCNIHSNSIQSISHHGLKNTKVPCDYCRVEQSLSSLNRSLRSSLGNWKRKSEINSNFQCVLTGSKIYDVHHLYSYNSIIKDALEELKIDVKVEYNGEEILLIKDKVIELHKIHTGICIRPDLHIIFHQLFGKVSNTPEQFEEFKIRYRNDEFLEVEKATSF